MKSEDSTAPAQSELVKICAVTSIPRLGWNDHWGCVVDALAPFKIPLRRFTGAYWGQHMQTALELCVERELDWILTLDYDALFSARHLDTMFGLFGQNPHIDALVGLQAKRNTGDPLMTIKTKGGEDIEITGAPVKVDTAHFGLTLLRVDALREIPKPWLCGQPGPDGTWTHPDHIDPDIWFWKQWAKAGKTLYVAPTVRIGHLEMMVSEFDADMNQHHITIGQWREENEHAKSRAI